MKNICFGVLAWELSQKRSEAKTLITDKVESADQEKATELFNERKKDICDTIVELLTVGKTAGEFAGLLLDVITVKEHKFGGRYGHLADYRDNIAVNINTDKAYSTRIYSDDKTNGVEIVFGLDIACGKAPDEVIEFNDFRGRVNYENGDFVAVQETINNCLLKEIANYRKEANLDYTLGWINANKKEAVHQEKYLRKLKSIIYNLQGILDAGMELTQDDYTELDTIIKHWRDEANRASSIWADDKNDDGNAGRAYYNSIKAKAASLATALSPCNFNLIDTKTDKIVFSHKADTHLEPDDLTEYITGDCRLEILPSY